jgi:hypothetical protein
LSQAELLRQRFQARPPLRWWVRGGLIGVALGLCGIFAIALWLHPYGDDGAPLLIETHRQLGLPPCTFYMWTNLPCPSCGMTSSFSLLMHGDVWNSLRANAVGTLFAAVCLASIPWSLASAMFGRFVFFRSLERALTRAVVFFFALALIRWGIVVAARLLSQ